MTTIAHRSTELLAAVAAQAPAHVFEAFRVEREGLGAAGVPASVAAVGTSLPNADLLDVNGNATTLAAALAGKPAVLVFYRGEWCPFCNIALKTYQADLVPALEQLGIPMLAISPQKPDGSLTMQQKHALTFAVFSDPGNALAKQLGILSPERSADARAATAAIGVDVPAANIDGTDFAPMPTTIIVRADGTIAWIDVHPNYATRSEVSAIVTAARAVTSAALPSR